VTQGRKKGQEPSLRVRLAECPVTQDRALHLGVADGTRTRDNRNHNPALSSPQNLASSTNQPFHFPTVLKLSTRIHAGFKGAVGKFLLSIWSDNPLFQLIKSVSQIKYIIRFLFDLRAVLMNEIKR
jgi:hypothetical protein